MNFIWILLKQCLRSPSIWFVKLNAKIISAKLSKIYNKCVECGVFPESLKKCLGGFNL